MNNLSLASLPLSPGKEDLQGREQQRKNAVLEERKQMVATDTTLNSRQDALLSVCLCTGMCTLCTFSPNKAFKCTKQITHIT